MFLANSGFTTVEYTPHGFGDLVSWILVILVVWAYHRSG